MSEDKMRAEQSAWEELDRIKGEQANVTTYHREAYDAGVKTCAAIKDAEIAEQHELWKDLRNVLECTQKEVASRDLMIKELREAVDRLTTICVTQVGSDYNDVIHAAYLQGEEALANSEHHDSKVLEKMLLEVEIKLLHNFDECEHKPTWNTVINMIAERGTKLAELNEE